jgi:hypothetical protein
MTYNPNYYRDGKMRMVRGNIEAISRLVMEH